MPQRTHSDTVEHSRHVVEASRSFPIPLRELARCGTVTAGVRNAVALTLSALADFSLAGMVRRLLQVTLVWKETCHGGNML